MQHLALAHLKELLYNRTPFLGAGQRLKAARALAGAEGAIAIEVLAEALVQLEDEAVHQVVLERLARAAEGPERDAVCALWEHTRHPRLEKVVREGRWLPDQPEPLRVRCALLWGEPGTLEDAGPAAVAPLLSATGDANPAMAAAAGRALGRLTNPDAREALCELVYAHGDPKAAEIVRDAAYLPAAPGARGAFLFMAGRWDDYVRVDLDGSILEQAWQAADAALRDRMADIAKQGNRLEWARLALRHATELSEVEWATMVDVLAYHDGFDELWQLAKTQLPALSVSVVARLVGAGWSPPADSGETALFEELVRLHGRCLGDPLAFADRRGSRTVFDGKPGQANRLAVSPDWRYLAVGGDDTTVQVFALPSGDPIATLTGLNGWVAQLAFSANGRFLAVSSMKHQTRVYRMPDGALLATLETQDVGCVAISRDGKTLVCNAGSRIDIWHVGDTKAKRSFRGDDRQVTLLVLSPRGDMLASTGTEPTAQVWSIPEGSQVTTLAGHEGRLTALAWSDDQQFLVTAAMDQTVRVWAMPDGQLLAEQTELPSVVKSLAIAPGGEVLVAGSHDNSLRLHRLSDVAIIDTLSDFHGSAGVLGINSMHQVLSASCEGKKTVKAFFPSFPRFDAELATLRLEELEFANRLHKDPGLSREERAWLGYWGNQALASRKAAKELAVAEGENH